MNFFGFGGAGSSTGRDGGTPQRRNEGKGEERKSIDADLADLLGSNKKNKNMNKKNRDGDDYDNGADNTSVSSTSVTSGTSSLDGASLHTSGTDRNHRHQGTEMEPMTLDYLTQRKQGAKKGRGMTDGRGMDHGDDPIRQCKGIVAEALERASWYMSVMCYFYPITCAIITFGLVLAAMMLLASWFWNPTNTYGVIAHDHTHIHSKYDLSMKDVHHWCLAGDNDSCSCDDPLIPTSRSEHKSWVQAFKANRNLVKSVSASGRPVDVVFLGESIVEEMGGSWMGRTRSKELQRLKDIFNQNFGKGRPASNATLSGLALGIAGDTSPNVLWRLLHGELTDETFTPKVYWLNLGLNDLGRMKCSEEIVELGILRIVEEILDQKPGSHVVINSILPMAEIRGGLYPLINDYRDAFDNKNRKHSSHNTYRSFPEEGDGGDGKVRRDLRLRNGREKKDPTKDNTDVVEKEEEKREHDARHPHHKVVRHYQSKSNSVTYTNFHNKDPVNPTLSDKKKVRVYNSKKGGLFLGNRNKIPLWTSIQAINKELKKFADQNSDKVTFFDATKIFAQKIKYDGDKHSRYMLKSDRISIRGHPTIKGYEMYEQAIATRLSSLLETLREKYPSRFNDDADNYEYEYNDDYADDFIGGGSDPETDGGFYDGSEDDFAYSYSYRYDDDINGDGEEDDYFNPEYGMGDEDDDVLYQDDAYTFADDFNMNALYDDQYNFAYGDDGLYDGGADDGGVGDNA